MKKFVTASFLLELVFIDSVDGPCDVQYDLRDRNGQLAVRGSLEDVKDFLFRSVENYKVQKSATDNGQKN